MEIVRKRKRFVELVIGFITLGLGQELVNIGLVQAWTESTPIFLGMGVTGILLIGFGLFFLGRLLYWFLRQYNEGNRVIKVFGLALLVTFAGGLVIGGLGQWVYDHSTFSYQDVKTAIWFVTSLLQSLIKVKVVLALYSFYKGTHFSWKQERVRRFLLLTALLVLVTASMGLLWHPVSGIVLRCVDTVVVLGTVYTLLASQE